MFQNPILKEGKLIGEVLHIDTFGNLIARFDDGTPYYVNIPMSAIPLVDGSVTVDNHPEAIGQAEPSDIDEMMHVATRAYRTVVVQGNCTYVIGDYAVEKYRGFEFELYE
jgi:hypothetical protein